MPTYQYRCPDCSNELEVVQKFTDEPLTECPNCHGKLRKVYGAVGVVFKGSGFYATDNRSKSKASGSDTSDSGSSANTDAKPKTEKKSKPTPANSDSGSKSTSASSTPAA